MSEEKQEKKLISYDLIMANLLLAGTKMAAILPTQPIHVVIRQQQAALASKDNPRVLSALKAYREIRSGQPFTSLFKGTAPGIVQSGLKNLIYKGALIKGAPDLADRLLPCYLHNNTRYHYIKSFSAGCIAAFSDTVFSGAFESYATYLSTSHGEHANASFLGELQKESNAFGKVRRAYQGFIPTTVKSTVASTTFFATTAYVQTITNTMYGLSPTEKMPWYATATSSVLSGLGVALTSSPFDIIKTHSQMPGATGGTVLGGLANNFKIHGLAGVTAGLPAKVLMITIGWGLTFFATQDNPEWKTNLADNSIEIEPAENPFNNNQSPME